MILKVHPESVQPLSEEEREDSQHRGDCNDDAHEGVLGDRLSRPRVVVEVGFVLER